MCLTRTLALRRPRLTRAALAGPGAPAGPSLQPLSLSPAVSDPDRCQWPSVDLRAASCSGNYPWRTDGREGREGGHPVGPRRHLEPAAVSGSSPPAWRRAEAPRAGCDLTRRGFVVRLRGGSHAAGTGPVRKCAFRWAVSAAAPAVEVRRRAQPDLRNLCHSSSGGDMELPVTGGKRVY